MIRVSVLAGHDESRCFLCDEEIYEGDEIVCVEDEWVHADCEDQA